MARTRKDAGPRTSNANWRHVSVYFPPKVFAEIENLAKESHRSVSAQIVVLVEERLKK